MQAVEYQPFRPSKYFSAQDSGLEPPLFATLRSEQEWKHVWAQIERRMSREMGQQEPHPLPAIDFDRYFLIVAAVGERPNGGFSVSIDSVAESPALVLVSVIERRPGHGCVVTLAITHPIAMALIPRTTKAVEFDVEQQELACG